MQCPGCGENRLFRIQRKGFLQRRIYALFGYYPWKCRRCELLQLKRVRREREVGHRKSGLE